MIRSEGAPMNDQGLGDWLAQIEKTSMLNEAEHLLFAVLEAVSSAGLS